MTEPYLTHTVAPAIDRLCLHKNVNTGEEKLVMPKAHQTLGLSMDAQENLIVHYSAFAPQLKNKVSNKKFAAFKSKLTYFDKNDPESVQETIEAFSIMMSDLNPHSRDGFKIGIPHTALTSDIVLYPDKPPLITYRTTMSTMSEQITPENAAQIIEEDPDHLFGKLQDVMQKRLKLSKKPGFIDITSELSLLLQADKLDYTLMNDIGAIYSTSQKDNTKIQFKKDKVIFGNTRNFSRDMAKTPEIAKRATLRATANRKAFQSINILAFSQGIVDGTNKFSDDFLETVADYCVKTADIDIYAMPWFRRGIHI